ncbi:MAG: hypothetical protein MJ252_02655, partial [archaeon]|nr:hypothetical protein [archaeon]
SKVMNTNDAFIAVWDTETSTQRKIKPMFVANKAEDLRQFYKEYDKNMELVEYSQETYNQRSSRSEVIIYAKFLKSVGGGMARLLRKRVVELKIYFILYSWT